MGEKSYRILYGVQKCVFCTIVVFIRNSPSPHHQEDQLEFVFSSCLCHFVPLDGGGKGSLDRTSDDFLRDKLNNVLACSTSVPPMVYAF